MTNTHLAVAYHGGPIQLIVPTEGKTASEIDASVLELLIDVSGDEEMTLSRIPVSSVSFDDLTAHVMFFDEDGEIVAHPAMSHGYASSRPFTEFRWGGQSR